MGRNSYDELQGMGPSPFASIPMLVVTSQPLPDAPDVIPVLAACLRKAVESRRGNAKDIWLFGGAQTMYRREWRDSNLHGVTHWYLNLDESE